MTEIEAHLAPVLSHRRPPAIAVPPGDLAGFKCPRGLLALLQVSDGFVTNDRLFRVFGLEGDEVVPGIEDWNRSEWKKDYGPLAQGILFVAEDIFGDQYGYDFTDGKKFVKFYCEGGEVEVLEDGMNWFISALVHPAELGALDFGMLDAMRNRGGWPAVHQHFAFKLPLIAGGEYEPENLGIESVALHLGMLSQLSARNARMPADTEISKFTPLDSI